jgi:hypothetical protein
MRDFETSPNILTQSKAPIAKYKIRNAASAGKTVVDLLSPTALSLPWTDQAVRHVLDVGQNPIETSFWCRSGQCERHIIMS